MRLADWICANSARFERVRLAFSKRFGKGKPVPTDEGWEKYLEESNGRHADAIRVVRRRADKIAISRDFAREISRMEQKDKRGE